MTKPQRKENERTLEYNVKTKDKDCKTCNGRSHTIRTPTCLGCGRARNARLCPQCGGMPERVADAPGVECPGCGTVSGKNPDYQPPGGRKGSSSISWL